MVMSLSGKLRASPDGWGESSQPGAGSTGHTTRVTARETDPGLPCPRRTAWIGAGSHPAGSPAPMGQALAPNAGLDSMPGISLRVAVTRLCLPLLVAGRMPLPDQREADPRSPDWQEIVGGNASSWKGSQPWKDRREEFPFFLFHRKSKGYTTARWGILQKKSPSLCLSCSSWGGGEWGGYEQVLLENCGYSWRL